MNMTYQKGALDLMEWRLWTPPLATYRHFSTSLGNFDNTTIVCLRCNWAKIKKKVKTFRNGRWMELDDFPLDYQLLNLATFNNKLCLFDKLLCAGSYVL